MLTADVVSNGLTIASVGFYSGTNFLGQASTAPYQWTWTNVLMGNYLLTARVVYNGPGDIVSSPPVGIVVAPSTNGTAIGFTVANGALQLSWPAGSHGLEFAGTDEFARRGVGHKLGECFWCERDQLHEYSDCSDQTAACFIG